MTIDWHHYINPEARFDWRSALVAALLAGSAVWLLSHGLPWFTSGLVSPTLMGRDLKPPGSVDGSRSVLITLGQVAMSLVYVSILAPIVTRLRGLWAVALGAVIGLGLYGLNYVVFHWLLDVGQTGSELPVIVTHVTFGALAAAAYKGMASRRNFRLRREPAP